MKATEEILCESKVIIYELKQFEDSGKLHIIITSTK